MIAQRHDTGNGNGRGRLLAHTEPTPACDRCAPPGASAPHEELASLLPELERHAELDLETIRYHLQQSDATARDGYWHASINEARSFLEALVMSIALVERRESLAEFRKGRETQGGIRLCRRYLHEIGFLDIDEDVLVGHVYGIAIAKGSHLGVADEAWCRVARRMVWTTGQYLARRYEAWKAADRPRADSGPPGAGGPSSVEPAPGRWRILLTTALDRLVVARLRGRGPVAKWCRMAVRHFAIQSR